MSERVFPGYLLRAKVRNGATDIIVAATSKSKDRLLWIKDYLASQGDLAISVRENDPIRCKALMGGIEHRDGEDGGIYLIVFEIDTRDAAPFAEVINQRCVVDFTPTAPQPKFGDATVVGVLDLRASGPSGNRAQMVEQVRTREFVLSESESEAMGIRKTNRKGRHRP